MWTDIAELFDDVIILVNCIAFLMICLDVHQKKYSNSDSEDRERNDKYVMKSPMASDFPYKDTDEDCSYNFSSRNAAGEASDKYNSKHIKQFMKNESRASGE